MQLLVEQNTADQELDTISRQQQSSAQLRRGIAETTMVRNRKQKARVDVVFQPWLPATEATKNGPRRSRAVRSPKGHSKAGVTLESFTDRRDGLSVDRPTLASTVCRASVLDGFKADPSCRGSPYGAKLTHGGGEGLTSFCKLDMIGPDPYGVLSTMSTGGGFRKNPNFKVCVAAAAACCLCCCCCCCC